MTILARDIMKTELHTVTPATTLADLERELLRCRVGGLPVVEGGRLVGIVSRSDIVRKLGVERVVAEEVSDFYRELAGFQTDAGDLERAASQVGIRLDAATVRDMMVEVVLSAAPDDPVSGVAATLVEHGIHRVPVVDAGGHLVGIVTSLDVARLVAEGKAAG